LPNAINSVKWKAVKISKSYNIYSWSTANGKRENDGKFFEGKITMENFSDEK
jgi:hypothetical protein